MQSLHELHSCGRQSNTSSTKLLHMQKSKGGALAGKVGLLPGKPAPTQDPVYPDLLHILVDTLLSNDYIGALHDLMYDQNASPFLQGMLTACEGNG